MDKEKLTLDLNNFCITLLFGFPLHPGDAMTTENIEGPVTVNKFCLVLTTPTAPFP